MDTLLQIGLSNAVAAVVLGLVALAVTRVWRNPYVGRCLWIVVLLKLLMPPVWEVPVYWYRPAAAAPAPFEVGTRTPGVEPRSLRATATDPDSVAPASKEPPALATPQVEPASERLDAVQKPPVSRNAPSRTIALPGLTTLWLLSAASIAALILVRVLQFRRLLRRADHAPSHVHDLAAQVAVRLGMAKLPRLRVVNATVPPLVWSAGGRATVALPAQLIERLPPEELKAVLAHELAHVRRRDGAARWLEIAAICTFWWHPVAWLARHKLQQAEEECCDADVLRVFPELRRGYAHALLNTLEFLSKTRTLFAPATGLTRRTCLLRRFEMIVRSHPRRRPAIAVRALVLSTALLALAAFPVVLPAEPKEEPNRHEGERIACTITLNDGTQIEGYIVRLADDRVVVQRKHVDGSTAVTRPDDGGSIDASTGDPSQEHWEISLSDCVAIALQNSDSIRRLRVVRADGELVLRGETDDPVRLLDAQAGVTGLLREIETAFWHLWLVHREAAIAEAAREKALEIWRTIPKPEATDEGIPARVARTREAQARSLLFAFRELVDTTQSDRLRAENRLRYLLGLASDGRIMDPSDEAATKKVEIQSDKVHAEALANRTELLKARLQLLDRTAELEMARLNLGSDSDHEVLRHHKLLVSRERAVLRDIELEASHQVADALRDISRDYDVARSRFKAMTAAQEEYRTLRVDYELEKVLLDVLLDALKRKTDAERNYYQAVADYAITITRLHERKGTLLERHGIEIVHKPAVEPEAEN